MFFFSFVLLLYIYAQIQLIIFATLFVMREILNTVLKSTFTFFVDPPFPQVPNSFQTRIEATIIDKNYTISGEEYFDYTSNQASITLLKDGVVFKLIFDYPNEQLFYVQRKLNKKLKKNEISIIIVIMFLSSFIFVNMLYQYF